MNEEIDRVEALCDAFKNLIGTTPPGLSLRLLRPLLDTFDVLLTDERRRYDYPIFNGVGEYVSSADHRDRLLPRPVWDWVKTIARSADGERQVAMQLCIFRYLVAEPVRWEDEQEWETVRPLFELWTDPATRWAVWSAYYE